MSDKPIETDLPPPPAPEHFELLADPVSFNWTGGSLVTVLSDPSTPALMLRSVVTLGEKTTEGHVIEAVTVAWFEIIRVMQNDPQAMHQIDWRTWEEIMAGAYKAAGFDEVILTPRSGDLGRDLIATRHDGFSIRIIDQVKKYAPGNLVPANDVRALLHVLNADRSVSKGYVTTTSDFAPGVFTDPFIQPYLPTRLELRSGAELVKMLVDTAAKRRK